MTSSVLADRFWYDNRIWCCLASSRLKTRTLSGSPASPRSRRRTSTWPSEPVPPVTSTRFPSSNSGLLPLSHLCGQLAEHGLVTRRRVAGGRLKSLGVQGPIDHDAVVWNYGCLTPKLSRQRCQQLVLADRHA